MTTNFANANYQEVIDLHTESDTVSVIGIHSPCTDTPLKMLSGFWDQFRKFKYNGCSISLVPAARLPADPLQVSYEAGETTIDPRDMLNPIMFHGCHGDDMGTILNSLYSTFGNLSGEQYNDVQRNASDSVDQNIFRTDTIGNDYVEALYYKALTDTTWKKAHPQAGFRKSGLKPMVYRVVAGRPISQHYIPTAPTDTGIAYDGTDGADSKFAEMGSTVLSSLNPEPIEAGAVSSLPYTTVNSAGDKKVEFHVAEDNSQNSLFTSRLESLGWIDTRSRHVKGMNAPLTGTSVGTKNDAKNIATVWKSIESKNAIPKVFMGMIMLPPAYKTEQYYRLIVNHNISFSGFRGVSMQNDDVEMINNAPAVYNFN
ncbi:capsid protein [Porcine associated smacovirus]|uniref:Capsid protein n=1 Tax=Cressdnaviricota sp. TaxID=2748378 RepID=A0A4D6IYU9_9VIRU|nr:capsid protein [Porcine associated smacovirus]QCC72676.1 capsid protein [Cressdnaviricota sp.]